MILERPCEKGKGSQWLDSDPRAGIQTVPITNCAVIYPAEIIRHYRQFIAGRRSQRPAEEYREPTNAECAEFRDHFSLRKVALGTCHRPYRTPCQHEHACFSELTV